MKELYENSYKAKGHFRFGENWQKFLQKIDPERIEDAKRSLTDFLGGQTIKEKTFVDIGCGSGLFSLAAVLLGAAKVVSVDVDDSSVECTRQLKMLHAPNADWTVVKGSALDERLLASLGQFDFVYSWGVLHHTGDMYRALSNIIHLVRPNGFLFLAIYNKFSRKDGLMQSLLVGTSDFWLKVKRVYNSGGSFTKTIIVMLYYVYAFCISVISLKNPFRKGHKIRRGMAFHTNVLDWLGGYPYEYATSDELIKIFAKKGLYCTNIQSAHTLECHQILFQRLG